MSVAHLPLRDVDIDARTLAILEHRRRSGRWRRRGWLVRRMLLLADVVGVLVAFAVAQILVGPRAHHLGFASLDFGVFVLTIPLWIVIAKVYGLYDSDEERASHTTVDDLLGVFHVVSVGTWIFFAITYAVPQIHPYFPQLLVFWGLAIALVTLARATARVYCRRRVEYIQNTVIVGAGDVGQLIARKILQHPEYGLNIVGFVDSEPKDRREGLDHLALLGSPDRLVSIVRTFDVDRVIFAFSRERAEEDVDLIRSLRSWNLQIDVVPRYYDIVGPHVGIHDIEGVSVLGLTPVKLSRSSKAMKRAFDVAVALVGLAVTAPLFAYLAIRIKLDSSGPVFFRQRRLGEDMTPFTLLKFRTMRVDTDGAPHREFMKTLMDRAAAPSSNGVYKLDREDAVTPFGRWLRKWSLDELPQLVNVLRGDMSLVGPRPCLDYERDCFEPHHFERFLVPAGLTGLWQVAARAQTSFYDALELDVAYARGWSLARDFTILLKTPARLMRKEATR